MKKIVYSFLVIIILAFISMNYSFAGMADWTREESEIQTNEALKEQEQRFQENKNKLDNFYLSNLKVENYSITPEFNKEINNYKIDEPVSEEYIIIDATAEDKNAQISGDGKVYLNSGVNNIEVKVTAENGFSNIYYIIINKKSEDKSPKLKDLSISAVEKNTEYKLKLSPEFDKSIYSYNSEINLEFDRIKIDYELFDENTEVTIDGDYSLPEEENIFNIKLINNGGSETLYKIKVTNLNKNIEAEFHKKNNDNYYWIIIPSISAFIVIIIFILIKYNKKRKKHKH